MIVLFSKSAIVVAEHLHQSFVRGSFLFYSSDDFRAARQAIRLSGRQAIILNFLLRTACLATLSVGSALILVLDLCAGIIVVHLGILLGCVSISLDILKCPQSTRE